MFLLFGLSRISKNLYDNHKQICTGFECQVLHKEADIIDLYLQRRYRHIEQ